MPKKKILIFDNDKFLADIMTVVMLNEGYQAKGVSFTNDFMQVVLDYKPDLLLMGHSIVAWFNAYELCCRVKINAETAHTPVIVLSVYENYQEKIINGYGPDEFIEKPFSLEELILQVKKFLFLKEQVTLVTL